MEKGDLAAVIIGLSLVILLMVVTSPPSSSAPASAAVPATRGPTTAPTPATTSWVTSLPTPETPVPTPLPARRITYTENYARFPVRFLPADMGMYGSSDIEWQYRKSVPFAYVQEDHGGITEPFTVDYPFWRMVTTVSAAKTPEKARFRMVLVDEQSGLLLEGVEIRFPGSVTKTVGAHGRPLYLVIAAENLDMFTVVFEAPSEFVR